MNPIEKYLDVNAEVRAMKIFEALRPYVQQPYERVQVVPAFDETTQFIKRLQKHPKAANNLIIVAVNRPQYQADDMLSAQKLRNPVARTEALWNDLQKAGSRVFASDNFCLIRCAAGAGSFDLLAVNMYTEEHALPPGQGVGLARKTGCDIALAAIHAELVQSPWIYSTDADAHLPDNYFCERPPDENVAAVHCAFKHFNSAGLSLAQQLYDLSLEYYVAGLTHAGSAYAHYSLGSALIINYRHYAAVRGFPKRAAGEDFYLLNKLAKVGRIEYDPQVTIALEERPSHRVPYGTGPAIVKIASLEDPLRDHPFYHPKCFSCLRLWLSTVQGLHDHRDDVLATGIKAWLLRHWHDILDAHALCDALETIGTLAHTASALAHERSPHQFLYQFDNGFDGLKTLRLIHQLRDHAFGVINAARVQQVLSSARWE